MMNDYNTDNEVSLRVVTADSVRTICNLSVSKEQERFVAPNAVSIAQAHFSGNAWFRTIYAGEIPVGFLMIYDDPEKPQYFLWRMMIDAKYQGNGYGRQAIKLLIEHVKTRPGAQILETSHREGDGSPGPFYEKMGFKYTGEKEDSELMMQLEL